MQRVTQLAYTIEVDISTQLLMLKKGSEIIETFKISSAKNGIGEIQGSECTPRGWHVIRAKIGANQLVNTVFVGRRPTGEIYSSVLSEEFPERDWILTRILWLSGLEPGKNRLGNVDTMRRYIYIHGCPDEDKLGQSASPSSHGCIKMRNIDIIRLFEIVNYGTRVLIHE